jgi:hypothetical protein
MPSISGMRGFDCLAPVSAAIVKAAVSDGYVWVGRYLNNLTPGERDVIFAAGLAILPLTEAMVGVALSTNSGASYGLSCAHMAQRLGVPAGVHVVIDLEDPAAGSDCAGHVNAMAGALGSTNYEYAAGLYLGEPLPPELTAAQIYAMRPDRYGRGSPGVPEPACGWCWVQTAWNVERWGIEIDTGKIQADRLGRLPTIWAPAPAVS